jgi:class 3 adenylate cyclase
MTIPDLHDLLHQAFDVERAGRFDQARSLLLQAIAQAPASDLGQEARLRLGKLQIYGGPPMYDAAETTLTNAREHAVKTRARHQEATAIHLLALLARQRGLRDQARELLNQSPEPNLAAELVETPGMTLAQYFHYTALLAMDRGDLNTAERVCFRAHGIYKERGHRAGLAEVSDTLANLMIRRGKPQRALAFARHSLEHKQRLGDRFGEAISLGTIGRAHMLLANYGEARVAFQQNLDIAREINDQRGVGIMLNSLGEVCHLLKEPEKALEYYRLNLADDRGPINAMFAHLGMGWVFLASNRVEEAETEFAQIVQLQESRSGLDFLANAVDGLRGGIAWRRGEGEVGERLLQQSSAAMAKANQQLDTIPLQYDLRDLYQRQGRVPEAVQVMAKALDLLNDFGAERGVRDVEEWMRVVDSPALTRLALERHFPEYLVEGILKGELVSKPPRRQVITVLFSDVRNFTKMAEGLKPEAVVEILNEWYTEATRAIHKQGGIVDKFIGDAVMALFGVPEPRHDSSACAIRAALDMRDALIALNLRNQVLGNYEISIGIGIHTGEAVVGFIGSPTRQSYTAIGDVVNIASRLESLTKDVNRDIAISAATEQASLVRSVAETEYLGMHKLKGKEVQTAVYAVCGRRNPQP